MKLEIGKLFFIAFRPGPSTRAHVRMEIKHADSLAISNQMTHKKSQRNVDKAMKNQFRITPTRQSAKKYALGVDYALHGFHRVDERVSLHKIGEIERNGFNVTPYQILSKSVQQFARRNGSQRFSSHC